MCSLNMLLLYNISTHMLYKCVNRKVCVSCHLGAISLRSPQRLHDTFVFGSCVSVGFVCFNLTSADVCYLWCLRTSACVCAGMNVRSSCL